MKKHDLFELCKVIASAGYVIFGYVILVGIILVRCYSISRNSDVSHVHDVFAQESAENPNFTPDADRIIKACFSAVQKSEAPTIEIFDEKGACVVSDAIGRKNESPLAGRPVYIPLYITDTKFWGTLKVSGACESQNKRIASAGYKEWTEQKRKSIEEAFIP